MGTVTVREVADAEEIVATFVAPKYTTLLAAVALKPVPVMVTDAPTAPLAGLKFEIEIALLVVYRSTLTEALL